MKLRKYTALMVCFLLLINVLALPSFKVKADGASRIFYTTDSNITVGQDFNIYVNAENITDLYGTSIDFKYDTSLMTVKSIQVGDAYAGLVSSSVTGTTNPDYFVVDTSNLTNGTGSFGVTLLGNTHATGLNITTAKSLFVIKATAKAAGTVNLNFVSGEPAASTEAVNSLAKLSNNNSQPISAITAINTNLTIASPTPLTVGKYEETNSNISYVGTWTNNANASHSGGSAKYSVTSGNYAEFKFTGTGFRWYSWTNPYRGIAKVTIDGTPYDVNAYTATETFQNKVYEKTDLTSGTHTVRIEVTSNKDPKSGSYAISLDALEILNQPVTSAFTTGKYEETNSNITYFGSWTNNANASHSGGSAKYSVTSGNYAEFKFTGTGFRWYSWTNPYRGIAKVTIDGTPYDVNAYTATETFQNKVYEKTGLTFGTHAVRIEVTNNKDPKSGSYAVSLDALEILDQPVTSALTAGKYEETNSNITYFGSWTNNANASHSGGSAKYSVTSGNYAEFKFTGTGFRWYSWTNPYRGIAKVTIDGTPYDVNAYTATETFQNKVYEKTDLTSGTHTVRIEVTSNKDPKSGSYAVSLDALEILDQPITSALAAGKYEETNSNITYFGSWTNNANASHSGGSAKYSVTSGNYAEFKFTGTGFRWYSWTNPYRGIAKVTIDGTPYDVNAYTATETFQNKVYEKTGLTSGTHTVRIEVTSNKDPRSGSYAVSLDALEILDQPVTSALAAGKYEETNSNITYFGSWTNNANASHSGSSAKYSITSGNYIEFKFTGTGFKWYSWTNPYRGIAKVTIDGTSYDVNTYTATETFQNKVYEKTGLTSGTHTVRIEVTSNKDPRSGSYAVSLDALEIMN